MGYLALMLLLLVATIAVRVMMGLTDDEQVQKRAWIPTAIGVALGVLFTVIAVVEPVPAGHVGIVDVFGSVQPYTLKPGINTTYPWAHIAKMSIQTQEDKETMEVPTSEGLSVNLEASLLFHLDPDKAMTIYKEFGEVYKAKLVDPYFRSEIRSICAGHQAKDLYTAQRDEISNAVLNAIKPRLGERGIIAEVILLRRTTLPELIQVAISNKLAAEQESQRMEFVLAKERQEAERKKIEAQGIADFQEIVTQGISDPLLRWKGIEATEKLAASPNAKIVIVGSGKDGLPIILGHQ